MAREAKAASAIKLVAVEPLLHDGRSVAPGDALEATAAQAVALMVSGAAITPEQAEARADAARPTEPPASAEPPAQAAPPEQATLA